VYHHFTVFIKNCLIVAIEAAALGQSENKIKQLLKGVECPQFSNIKVTQ
jgi:hypothetical protein